jgi:uncharacterized protein YwbE
MNDLVSQTSRELADYRSDPLPEAVESALVNGDLAKLTTAERVAWYLSRCKAAGLNPATRPFEYISLQGKLTLYATKACTDQLSGIHGISHELISRETVDGVHVVTVKVRRADGRETCDLGAVPIQGLKGADLANAFMKAITKAKRRSILSLCGLGDVMDESELDTVSTRPCTPSGQLVKPDHQTGYGSGMYASPEDTKTYLDALMGYLDKRNAQWCDYWQDRATGEFPEGFKRDLLTKWQADKHLVKWAVETGRLDPSIEADGLKNGQIGRFTAIVYQRDRRALANELARYADEQADRMAEKIKAGQPGALPGNSPAADDSESEDLVIDPDWEPGANG